MLGRLPPPGTAETNTVPVPEHQLPAEELLALTKELLFAQKLGFKDPTLLDDDLFTFTGPAVGGPRSKADFLSPSKTRRVLCVGTFQFEDEAFPDLDYQYRDLAGVPVRYQSCLVHVESAGDPHGGPDKLGTRCIHRPSGPGTVHPNCGSMQFNTDGHCIGMTGGYIMDRRDGQYAGPGRDFWSVCRHRSTESDTAVPTLHPPPKPGARETVLDATGGTTVNNIGRKSMSSCNCLPYEITNTNGYGTVVPPPYSYCSLCW